MNRKHKKGFINHLKAIQWLTKKGYFVIDEVKEGGNTFFNVTRAVQYTETYKIADFSELS